MWMKSLMVGLKLSSVPGEQTPDKLISGLICRESNDLFTMDYCWLKVNIMETSRGDTLSQRINRLLARKKSEKMWLHWKHVTKGPVIIYGRGGGPSSNDFLQDYGGQILE